MTEVLGVIGSVCFAISGVPAAVEAIRKRTCAYNWSFLGLWFVGEACCIGYALLTGQWVLLLNYIPNMACLLVLTGLNNRQ